MRRPRALEVAAGASLASVALSFAGWGRSGEAVRSSYGLFQAAGRAGVLPDSVERWGMLFFFVPAVVGAALVAHAAHRPTVAATLYASTAIMLLAAVALVVLSPLGVEVSAIAAGASAGVAMAASFRALWLDRRGGEQQ